jgi:hypothetical protein
MKYMIVSSLLMLSLGCAQAADWITVDGGDKSWTSVDMSSIINLSPAIKRAWVKHTYVDAQMTDDYPKQEYRVVVVLSHYDCHQRTVAQVRWIRYQDHAQQKYVDGRSNDKNRLTFQEVVPETIDEAVLDYVCKPSAKK